MAFESLSERLNKAFKNISGQGKLTEKNMNDMLKEVRMSLLEADVNYDVVKSFVENVKEDILAEEIYVFTPDGTVRSLPKDSGPIDFAYEIHTKVGEKAIGAKVNGRMVPLNTKLRTGDQVEIITNANSFGPSRDWLTLVKPELLWAKP